jgi:hypothetical protein
MVKPIKTPAFWSVACPVRRRFFVFRSGLEKCYGISLPDPSRDDLSGGLSSFKQFCSALLERRISTWSAALQQQHVGIRVRMSVAHSLFLFRKVIPSQCPSLEPLYRKVQDPSPDPDPDFMKFVRRELPKILPRGWAKGYTQACLITTIPTKNCFESRMTGENSRMSLLLLEDDPRYSFVESVLATYGFKGRIRARLTAVSTSGKWRVLSIPSVEMNYLRPLHTCLYDYLCRYDWLLRGDAKPSAFKSFLRREGELFVSGDYESATDNLNSNVQKEILRIVLQGASRVPNEIKRLAFSSLSLEISDPLDPLGDATSLQQSGQMMGNLLSFPLLCLVNYLTFRYTVGASVPVRINGDDIVFRSTPEIADKWMENVSKSGLVLSKGKTLVDPRFFSLNSCLFQASGNAVVGVPFVRMKTLFGLGDDEDPIGSISGRFSSFCPNFVGRRRLLWRSIFLRENAGYINKSCRSLSRGLGVPVRSGELKESGLWVRELRYLELPSERKPPPTSSVWKIQPADHELTWVDKAYKRSKEDLLNLRVAFIDAAWQMPLTEKKSYRETYFGGLDLSDRVFLRTSHRLDQKSKLLKMSHPQARSWLRLREADLWSGRPIRSHTLQWMPLSRQRFFVGKDGVYNIFTPQISKSQSSPLEDDCLENFPIVPGLGVWSFAPPPPGL